jgi:hypothetical protein
MSISQRGTRLVAQGTLLAPAAFLYFVDLFLPWSRVCMRGYLLVPPSPFSPGQAHAFADICQPQTGGWGGAGTVAGVLAGLLFLWEATRVARLDLGVSFGYRSLISATLAFGDPHLHGSQRGGTADLGRPARWGSRERRSLPLDRCRPGGADRP